MPKLMKKLRFSQNEEFHVAVSLSLELNLLEGYPGQFLNHEA